MQNEYGARGLQVLASATEDMAAAALPGFLRQFEPPFPVGINTTAEFIAYMQHPTMLQLYMPGLVFIDKDGVIRDAIRRARLVSRGIQRGEEYPRQSRRDADASGRRPEEDGREKDRGQEIQLAYFRPRGMASDPSAPLPRS